MSALPKLARVYVLGVVLAAVAMAILSFPFLPLDLGGLLQVGSFFLLFCLADIFPIVLRKDQAEISVSAAIGIASVLLFGPAFSIWLTLLGTFVAEVVRKKAWYKAAFNAAQVALTFGIVGIIYLRASGGNPPLESPRSALALLPCAIVYYLLNNGLVSLVIALAEELPVRYVWQVYFRDVAWHDLATIPLGVMFAILWSFNPWSILLVLLPLAVVRQSFQLVSDLRQQTRESLTALADIIDQRDPSTYQHSQRVAEYAMKIAQQLRLPQDQVDLIVFSARLHDLGKIGMSNELLFNPGTLSEEEWSEFRQHPAIGATMVGRFSLFSKGKDLILHHHERYDGTGYPEGKGGDEIPWGARIIAVADAYDAMTSPRPYRPPLSNEETIQQLQRSKGSQFDPQAVDALLRVLEEERVSPALSPERIKRPLPVPRLLPSEAKKAG